MQHTKRLALLPCQPQHIEAYLRSRERLADLLRVAVPPSWPVFPESLPYWANALKQDRWLQGWATWLFIHQDDNVLIGEGGFKGKPDAQGAVEIGYAIIEEYRQGGYATEAVQGLLAHAFAHEQVRIVRAHTLPDNQASIRVLEKNAFQYLETIEDPEEGPLLTWWRMRS